MMMLTGTRSASASASAVLPLAVGPAISPSGLPRSAMPPPNAPRALLLAPSLPAATVATAEALLAQAGLAPLTPDWIEFGEAAVIGFAGSVEASRDALSPLQHMIDIVVLPRAAVLPRLLVSDMDSTMISVECIDELADYAGCKPQVAAITERAMRGEIDFAGALAKRVALLEGLPEEVLHRCLAERVRPMPGAATLVRTLAGQGCHTVLVSGGFTAFAEPVARAIGLAEVHANRLEVIGGRLTGRIAGPLVDAVAKHSLLQRTAARLGVPRRATLAIGDGANDAPMIKAAGLGVGFRPKPALACVADAVIRRADLNAILFLYGLPRSAWAGGE